MSSDNCEVLGVGAVTGYGWGVESLWQGLMSGESAASQVAGYDPSGEGLSWIALVPDGGDLRDGPTRFARAMRASAREAIEDAARRGWLPGERVGLVHAVVLGEVDLWRDFYLRYDGRLPIRDYLYLMPSSPVSLLMQEYGFRGPAMNVSAMCASGNAAMLTGKAWLDAGIVDDVIVIATDLSATRENVLHFKRLGVTIIDAEPLDACRPFQEGSRGFIMGEASAAFVLSKRASGAATPYVRALGGAMTHDAHHVTSVEPDLISIRACVAAALRDAGVPGSAVRYFHAHGPGTKQCDRAETSVLAEFFPPETGLYSIKPLVAHCQGAASAVEIVATALAYERGIIPAPGAVAPAHPRLLSGPTPISDGVTVKSSLGLGGHNSVVLLAPAA